MWGNLVDPHCHHHFVALALGICDLPFELAKPRC